MADADWNSVDDSDSMVAFGGTSIFVEPQTVDRLTPPTGPVLVGETPPAEPIVMELATLDAHTTPVGPLFIRIAPPPDPPPPPGGEIGPIVEPERPVYATLHEPDGTLVSQLSAQAGLTWRHALNETGAGSVQVPYDHADAAQLIPGRRVRCYYHGLLAFTFVIEGHPTVIPASPDEHAGEWVQAQGRGLGCVLDGALVLPASGIAAPLNHPQRLFSFASPDFPNATNWTPAVEQFQASELDTIRSVTVEVRTIVDGIPTFSEFVRVPAPRDYPVGDAYWIWGQLDSTVVGRNYFRKNITLTEDTRYSFAVTADNLYTLFLDGVPLVGEDTDTWIWQAYKLIHIPLPPGQWTLAAVVENTPGSVGPGENPAALLNSVFIAQDNAASEDEIVVSEVIDVTDSSWRALAYPEHPPGWTPSQVILRLIAEAQARGEATGVTTGFTAFADSNGNAWRPSVGAAWAFMSGFSVPIGESILRALNQLETEGWVDWIMLAGGTQLRMWSQGQGGSTTSVTFTRGVNITSHECAESDRVINRLLVKWPGGLLTVQDDTSIASMGQVVAAMVTVEADTADEARRRGERLLLNQVQPNQSILMGIAPDDGEHPYLDFVPGDWITAPDRTNSPDLARVISISVDATEDEPRILLELNERWTPIEVRQAELLQTIGSGLVGQPGSTPLITINPRRDMMQDA